MVTKSERVEARLSPRARAQIERAAALSGVSLSTFLVDAATERADEVLSAATTTLVDPDYFDVLLASLDHPDPAPGLSKAAEQAARRPAIAT